MGRADGDGYAVAGLEDLGQGYGFRKVRKELGVSEFGANAIVLPPGLDTGFHAHERQQELYFVHTGTLEFEFGDGSTHVLEAGAFARVDAPTMRRIKNVGDNDAIYVIVGGADGYVGRDGIAPEGEPGVRETQD